MPPQCMHASPRRARKGPPFQRLSVSLASPERTAPLPIAAHHIRPPGGPPSTSVSQRLHATPCKGPLLPAHALIGALPDTRDNSKGLCPCHVLGPQPLCIRRPQPGRHRLDGGPGEAANQAHNRPAPQQARQPRGGRARPPDLPAPAVSGGAAGGGRWRRVLPCSPLLLDPSRRVTAPAQPSPSTLCPCLFCLMQVQRGPGGRSAVLRQRARAHHPGLHPPLLPFCAPGGAG